MPLTGVPQDNPYVPIATTPRSPRAFLVILLLLPLPLSCSGDRGGQSAGQRAPAARATGARAASVAAPVREHPTEIVLHATASDREDERGGAPSALATLHGDVLLGGRLLCRHPFEVRLTPIPNTRGGPPLRKLFGDGTGRFRLWPPPGRYRLRIFAGDRVSDPRVVDLPPGNPGESLRITVH